MKFDAVIQVCRYFFLITFANCISGEGLIAGCKSQPAFMDGRSKLSVSVFLDITNQYS